MLDALLSLGAASSGVNSVFEMCKNVSGVFKGNQKDLYLNYLDSFDKSFKKISQNIERVSDKILIAPNLEIVQDVNKTRQQKIEDLKEARESLEPIQRALDTEILSSAMILTPEKMQAALAKNPWLVLLDVRPISRVTSPNNPDLVPVVFHDNGMQYVGWQMRGTLPILFDCKFDELLIPKPVAEIFEENELEQFQERLFNRSQNKSTKSNKFEKDKGKPFQFEVVFVDEKGKIIDKKQLEAYCKTEALGKGVNLEMVYIPSGTFKMGSNEENREKPIHSVTVPEFYMSKYPITQKQYQTIMGEDPARFKGENHPVERVSWDNAVAFCKKLSEKTGKNYQLPSEAQWEYACRAGTTTPFYFGETITTDLANYNGDYTYASEPEGKCRQQTTDVDIFPPNAFGLYDMHGNVWEWCADNYHDNYEAAPIDGSVWSDATSNNYRVLRGGSWNYHPNYARSADRNGNYPNNWLNSLGFRVVCSVL